MVNRFNVCLSSFSHCFSSDVDQSSSSQKPPPNVLDRHIPITTYEAPVSAHSEPESCSICLVELTSGEAVRVLPSCKHVFHAECINQWLPRLSKRCPVCRSRAIDDEFEPVKRGYCSRNNGNTPLLMTFSFGNQTNRYI